MIVPRWKGIDCRGNFRLVLCREKISICGSFGLAGNQFTRWTKKKRLDFALSLSVYAMVPFLLKLVNLA
jgi:hypothetical protein